MPVYFLSIPPATNQQYKKEKLIWLMPVYFLSTHPPRTNNIKKKN